MYQPIMKPKQMLGEMVGEVFGRLVVLAPAGRDHKRQLLWECQCECGKRHITAGTYLRTGHTKSCGCLQPEVAAKSAHQRLFVHGLTRTLTGASWTAMMQRCFNPKRKDWGYYGERGIKPCQFIKASPLNVVVLIGFRTSKSLTLDRINSEFGYTCGKCEECIANKWKMNIKWSTRAEQNRNKRKPERYGIWAKSLNDQAS